MATVAIPLFLKDLTGGARRAEVSGENLGQILRALDTIYPGFEAKILSDGKIQPYVTFTVDGAIAGRGLDTPVRPESEVCILPSMGGGC
jgi:molybdopterin synthase sulfur carrier subunit